MFQSESGNFNGQSSADRLSEVFLNLPQFNFLERNLAVKFAEKDGAIANMEEKATDNSSTPVLQMGHPNWINEI